MRGFTLIELLIVIALIAVLAGAVIIALNPARQFALARNSTRWSHVSSINDLIQQNVAENQGLFRCNGVLTVVPTTSTYMASTHAGGQFDICSCLVPTYTPALPYDPSTAGAAYTDCTTYDTEYMIQRDASTSRITVTAPGAELGATISATR
jgi:prepilin-type N-terminal cleavage/methylation domain-containing protein